MNAPFFPGQPGYEDDDPQPDPALKALFDAFDALRVAATFADDPDEGRQVDEALDAAETAEFEFEPSTDEARGLHLLIGAVRRKAAEVTS